MLPTLDRSVDRLRQRVFAAAWVEHAQIHIAIALLAAGVAVLLARTLALWDRPDAALLLALALIAPITAWLAAKRRVPSRDAASVWLDVRADASGSIVTENELGGSPWSPRASAGLQKALAALPSIRLDRRAWLLVAAAAFVALALWIDPRRVEIGPPPAVATSAIERVEEKLDTLEEEVELEPEAAEEMHAQIERIEAEAGEGRPESTFEALDRLDAALDQRAEEALQAAARAARELDEAASDSNLAEAQSSLQDALKQMGDAGLAKDLPKEMQQALQQGTLSLPPGVQLSSLELAKLSQELKGVLDARLAKLAQGGLLDPKSLKSLGELGKLASLDDFDFDHECDGECKKPGGT